MTEKLKDATFAMEIEKVILDCLENRGFKRFRKYNADKVLSDDFAIWIGLNRGVYPGRVSFSPHIGVHAFKIERLLSKLDKSRKYSRGTATFSRALVKFGMTLEQCNFFNDGSKNNIMPNAVELANLLAGPALEWAISIANYDTLETMLARRVDRLGGYPESLACCLYLNGKKEVCLKFMAEYLAKYPDWKQYVEPVFAPLKNLIENKSSKRYGDILLSRGDLSHHIKP